MNRLLSGVSAGALLLAFGAGAALAGDLPGKFEGVTVDVKLIGGQQYEKLYERIPEWEKLTGAKVNILTKKNGFDIDKELKSDIASGSTNWCVGWNHSSFAPQYTGLYTDLSKLLPKEEIDAFVPSTIKSATIDGKLEMLPRAQFDVSALYYQKSLYENADNKTKFKANKDFGKLFTADDVNGYLIKRWGAKLDELQPDAAQEALDCFDEIIASLLFFTSTANPLATVGPLSFLSRAYSS